MKRRWLWALVPGLLAGVAIGYGVAAVLPPPMGRAAPAGPPAGGSVLDWFDIAQAAARAGRAEWVPVPGQPEFRAGEPSSSAVSLSGLRCQWSADELQARARRLVARAELPAADRAAFLRTFADAVADVIRTAGAVTGAGGHGDAPTGDGMAAAGPRVYWFYQHYSIPTTAESGGAVGVVQAWLVGDGPVATLVVTITEARYEAK